MPTMEEPVTTRFEEQSLSLAERSSEALAL